VTITAIQPRLRLSGTNRLGFQPSMAISEGDIRLEQDSRVALSLIAGIRQALENNLFFLESA
ncbi:MAG: hypothetical protein KZQ65_11590, partial [Candidatus Thiodiazotropha sp. (ex Gloverina cf. vestifex)]|nr:hypothetical protein [Candidatus Thiodiazotropha sp. (ex Gloverina cf. vestifex)]